jgi:hypothetical protein
MIYRPNRIKICKQKYRPLVTVSPGPTPSSQSPIPPGTRLRPFLIRALVPRPQFHLVPRLRPFLIRALVTTPQFHLVPRLRPFLTQFHPKCKGVIQKLIVTLIKALRVPLFDGTKAKFEEFWSLFLSLVDASMNPSISKWQEYSKV